jgi:hypothetical protein
MAEGGLSIQPQNGFKENIFRTKATTTSKQSTISGEPKSALRNNNISNGRT